MSCTVVIKDKNLKPENIKMGITILKVAGTYEGDGPVLEEKTVNSSTLSQEVLPGEGYEGLSKVTVNPYTLDSKTVNSSTSQQTVTSSADGLSSVTVNPYTLDSKTVNSSTSQQTVTSSADGLSSVVVEPYTLDSKTVDPSTSQQTVNSSADGLSSVTVNAVSSSIDSNIQAGNIKKDVTILGVTGTYESAPTQPNLQDVSVTYLSNGNYTLSASDGYDGLGTVDVSVNIDGATNWIEEVKLGNITDISGYSIAKLVKKTGGAMGLLSFSNVTNLPRIQDSVDNPNSDVGANSLEKTFSDCKSLQSVDMSIGSIGSEGMKECFSKSGVRDVSIYVGAINNNTSNIFDNCFYNCFELRNLYIKLGPAVNISGLQNAFRNMCNNASRIDSTPTIKIEGLREVPDYAFESAFSAMQYNLGAGIEVNLPDNLSTVKDDYVSNAFGHICQSSHLAGKTTPSFLGKLDYIYGGNNLTYAFSGTDVETATLGFNTCGGDNNFYNTFNNCHNLKSITFDGSFNVSGRDNFSWTFEGCYWLTSMTCTSTAGTKPFRYDDENNVASSAGSITDITIDNVNSNVYLLWNPSVNRASVYGILSKAAGATIQEGNTRTISFYESGLTVTDYPDKRIQTAYNAAVADGWTINNLTINQPTSEIFIVSPAKENMIYTDSSTITFITGTPWTATADSGITLSANSGNVGDASINITLDSDFAGSKSVTISTSNDTVTIIIFFPDDPNKYDFVDYIESTGQKITLGNPMRSDNALYAEYEFKASDASGGIFIGTDAQDSRKIGFGRDDSNNIVEYFGTNGVHSFNYSGGNLNTKYKCVMGIIGYSGAWAYMDENGVHSTKSYLDISDFAGTGSTQIRFADANNYGKLWSLKVYENLDWINDIKFSGSNILINENPLYSYVPAKRKSDNAYGLYETITNQFYTATGITGGMNSI